MPVNEPKPADVVRILLIDDDEDDYLLTRDIISEIPHHCYQLDWESDFNSALIKICGRSHDVYLIDFRLGAKTGLDLIREVRKQSCSGPVILLTGLNDPEVDKAAEDVGANDFLEKSRLEPILLERSIRYARRQWVQEAELERKVEERTRALVSANEALRKADSLKDEFLATLAHELRNPLAPIRNSIEITRLTADNPVTMKKSLDIIERQVNHLVRLIDDLLDVSRITQNKLRVVLETIDLVESIRAALETVQPKISAAHIRLDVLLPDKPILVSGDAVRLAQLFSNLLTNSVKFTEVDGSIALIVEQESTQVRVRIQDSGIGISPEFLSQVFDLFTQVDVGLNRSQGGLGIGLSLVKSLVEMHGGTVEAHSEGLGHGAEFVVTMPLLVPN